MSEQIYAALLPAAGLAAGTLITYIIGQGKVNQRNRHITELEGTVETRDKRIKSLNKSLKKQRATGKALKTDLSQRNGHIEEMEGTVRTLGNKIDSVNQSLRKQRATLEAKNTDLSQRDAAIQGLEKQVRERNKSIKAANSNIAELGKQNRETMDRAVGAEAQVSELQELMQHREQEIAALKAKGRAMQDDFSHLDGVGPKISETLRSVGVKPIAEFSAEEVDELREAQVARTRRPVKLNDPTTWPEQAGMAEEGKRETLNTLQDGLKEMLRKERPSTQESPEIETTTVVADA